MVGATLGGKGEHRHPRTGAQQLAREPGGGDRDFRELVDGRFGNDAAVGQEHHARFAEAGVLHLHDHATGGGGGPWGDFDDLEEGTQDTAGDLVGAGNESVGAVHGDHHGAEIIRFEHDLASDAFVDALEATEAFEPCDIGRQIVARLGVDDPDAFDRHIEAFRERLDPAPVAQKDGDSQAKGMELARRQEHARLGALRKDDALWMPLQLVDDARDEPHGRGCLAHPPPHRNRQCHPVHHEGRGGGDRGGGPASARITECPPLKPRSAGLHRPRPSHPPPASGRHRRPHPGNRWECGWDAG